MIEALAIFAAGVWAGAVNAVVGAGALVTFPTLLFFGYPPLTANISNNVGIVAGGLSGVHGYRRELRGNYPLVRRLLPASVLGGIAGAFLLFVLPAEYFSAIVPILIGVGVVMVLAGPYVQRQVRERTTADESGSLGGGVLFWVAVFVTGVYGGYFGAAQGVLLTGIMGMFLTIGLQRITAVRNVLTTGVNLAAAVIFLLVAWDRVDWKVVALIGGGAVVGGQLGARYGRRLPAPALRALIATMGVIAIVKLVVFG